MKNSRKQDIELAIAAGIVMAYMAILTYALLDGNNALALWDTAVLVCLLHICWQADKQEKSELRRRQARSRMMQQSLDELEQWRQARESD